MITEKESIIWASGHYLSNHLPEEYDEWDTKDIDNYLLSNVWQPFEYYSADEIWSFIETLAYDFQWTLNKKLKEKA